MDAIQFFEGFMGTPLKKGGYKNLTPVGMINLMEGYARSVASTPTQDGTAPIDKVTIQNLGVALRMVGITFDDNTIDQIIDLVELIETKGDDVSIRDIGKLQNEWKK